LARHQQKMHNRAIDFIHKYKANRAHSKSVEYVLIAYLGVPEEYDQWRIIMNLPEFLVHLTIDDMHSLGLVCRALDFLIKSAQLYNGIKDVELHYPHHHEANYHLGSWYEARAKSCIQALSSDYFDHDRMTSCLELSISPSYEYMGYSDSSYQPKAGDPVTRYGPPITIWENCGGVSLRESLRLINGPIINWLNNDINRPNNDEFDLD